MRGGTVLRKTTTHPALAVGFSPTKYYIIIILNGSSLSSNAVIFPSKVRTWYLYDLSNKLQYMGG